MITFTSLLWIWKGEAAGRWHFVTVPDEQSAEIKAHAFGSPRGFGSVRVEASVKGVTWRTSVFPLNSGGYLLPVKVEVRKKADLAAGDEVAVELDLL
ncbi:MAG TPA: DUF1905 domain-containing protein [Sphingomicrobium sp.]|nr:DUF1905 domain-containing protein [Sphingomicrobium sp.]